MAAGGREGTGFQRPRRMGEASCFWEKVGGRRRRTMRAAKKSWAGSEHADPDDEEWREIDKEGRKGLKSEAQRCCADRASQGAQHRRFNAPAGGPGKGRRRSRKNQPHNTADQTSQGSIGSKLRYLSSIQRYESRLQASVIRVRNTAGYRGRGVCCRGKVWMGMITT